MHNSLFHIYRNTPFGRETLLHSIYFSKQLQLRLSVYIPRTPKFLMYFDPHTVQVDLDASYLKEPKTAQARLKAILQEHAAQAELFEPTEYTASSLPDLPTSYGFMTCPRVISELSSSIGLGHIGSKVRNILKHATFPLLIPSQTFKPWTSLCVMFGGSINGVKSLNLGLQLAKRSGLPLDVFTQAEGGNLKKDYEQILRDRSLEAEFAKRVRHWYFQESRDLSTNLFDVPHAALMVMGIYGHSLVKDFMFGSTTEVVQTTLPNSLLLVGPGFKYHPLYSA
jgi:nucleotide-binding universal stress UspA family protein